MKYDTVTACDRIGKAAERRAAATGPRTRGSIKKLTFHTECTGGTPNLQDKISGLSAIWMPAYGMPPKQFQDAAVGDAYDHGGV